MRIVSLLCLFVRGCIHKRKGIKHIMTKDCIFVPGFPIFIDSNRTDILVCVLFNDDAQFCLNGYTNCRGWGTYGANRILLFCMKFQYIIKRLEYDVLFNVTECLNFFSSGIQMTEMYSTMQFIVLLKNVTMPNILYAFSKTLDAHILNHLHNMHKRYIQYLQIKRKRAQKKMLISIIIDIHTLQP